MSLSHLFISSRLQLERVKQRRSGKDNFYRSTLASPATRYVTLLCLMKDRNWICPSCKLQSSYCITIGRGPLPLVITKDIYVIKYITYNMNLQSKHISRVDEQQGSAKYWLLSLGLYRPCPINNHQGMIWSVAVALWQQKARMGVYWLDLTDQRFSRGGLFQMFVLSKHSPNWQYM